MVAWISITVKVTVLLFYHSNETRGSLEDGGSWREFASLVRRITSRLSLLARRWRELARICEFGETDHVPSVPVSYSNETRGSLEDGGSWREFASLVRRITSRLSLLAVPVSC